MLKLGRRARGHFVTLIEIRVRIVMDTLSIKLIFMIIIGTLLYCETVTTLVV